METLLAAKRGDIKELGNLFLDGCNDINFKNSNYDSIDESRPKKSMYCAECYQRVKRRDRNALRNMIFGSTFSCDWSSHQRSVVVTDPNADICCCNTPSGEKCNWLICVDCFTKTTHDLNATHQMYGLQEGFTALIAAASAGHIEAVRWLLDRGADINIADPKGLTALLAATSASHTDIVKLLLERGADINAVDHLGLCALFMAAELGDASTVEVLLAFNPDLSLREVGSATVLHAAASGGHVGIMRALLDRGMSAADTDRMGDTPLHWIPGSGTAASVRLLLDRGADVNAQNNLFYTPILLATLRDNAAAATAMLNAGAITSINTIGWGTPLTASCLGNFHRVTEVLLAGGVDSTIGTSPLDICARRNYPQPAAVCLKYGVEGAGVALVRAADVGNPAVVKVILQHWTGEDDMDDRFLARALAHAARSGVISSVRMLLEQGADATVPFGPNGETAEFFSKTNKIKGIIRAHVAGDEMEVEEEDEETVGNNRNHLLHALKKGTKKWGRSKIMIVGDGRAGKTALANSIMGEEFAHTESTIGINQMTCDVKFAEVGKEGQWDEYVKPDKELEAALAKIVAARRNGEEDDDTPNLTAVTRISKANTTSTGIDSASRSEIAGASTSATRIANGTVSIETEEPEEAAAKPESVMVIDDALVMKYLANVTDNTKFIISLFDYGGQTVFNVIHHLFLTRYGVYTLVFNMEQLVSPDAAVRANCLSTISFWLNSIVVHTWNTETESMAPIVIVGTHKDIVNSSGEHIEISQMLHDKFSSSVAWSFIQPNIEVEDDGEGNLTDGPTLYFFPVDNRKSRKDTTVVKMMKLIEDIIDKSDYVHVERPLTWLQTMDKLTASGKAFLPLVEVEEIARQCDVPQSAVPSLLSFLHEMGIVMWHDDVSLRDIVILDAVAYFVTPVTTIICKHLSTATDVTRHVVDVHKKCRRDHYDAWMKMVHQGIVNNDIIDVLLEECGDQAPTVLHLMVKFGLVVPLQVAEQVPGETKSNRTDEFLVPALLPTMKEAPDLDQTAVSVSEEYVNTCYFVFSCSSAIKDCATLSFADTTNLGFLPRGLFERLICKAVEWCRETSAVQSLQSQPLFQDAAVLVFGNQKFRMRAFHDKNIIEVNFTAGNPLAVHQRLSEQLQQILDECMKSLRFYSFLPDTQSSSKLVSLDYLKSTKDEKEVASYNAWLVNDSFRDEYDVFISYHWETLDSRYTERLRDRFTTYNLGEENRAVSVFLDSKRLRDGRNFVDDFARALVNSLIVVPVVSSDALQRMRNHDPCEKDHTLMEWFMALECLHSSTSRVKLVVPIFFGARDSSSDAIGDLFSEALLESMPDVHPRESIRAAMRLLHANGVEPEVDLSTYTVRNILLELKSLLGYRAWQAEDASFVVAQSAARIFDSLQDNLLPVDAQKRETLPRRTKSDLEAEREVFLVNLPPPPVPVEPVKSEPVLPVTKTSVKVVSSPVKRVKQETTTNATEAVAGSSSSSARETTSDSGVTSSPTSEPMSPTSPVSTDSSSKGSSHKRSFWNFWRK